MVAVRWEAMIEEIMCSSRTDSDGLRVDRSFIDTGRKEAFQAAVVIDLISEFDLVLGEMPWRRAFRTLLSPMPACCDQRFYLAMVSESRLESSSAGLAAVLPLACEGTFNM